MHSKTLLAALLFCSALAASGPCAAQDTRPQDRPREDASSSSGNKLRPLPRDTFNPSEEVSEDFPVPFPVDI
jgi:hypothetical protein